MSDRVDVGEVQGNVVHTYGTDYGRARYAFFRVDELTPATRDVVARWLARVTFSNPTSPKGPDPTRAAGAGETRTGLDLTETYVNIAFTSRGLRKLGVPPPLLAGFPDDFMAGARTRSESLGDHWRDRATTIALHEAHLMLTIHGTSESARDKRWNELEEINTTGGQRLLVEIHRLDASLASKSDPRERFGFADGLSQPAIAGVDIDAVGDGVYAGEHPRAPKLRRRVGLTLEDFGLRPLSRSWRLIRTGEFLLGYENEDGRLPEGSDAPLGPNSTFMVYREIDQHVSEFNEYVEKWARRLDLTEAQLRAKIVGRWRNGTPAIRRWPEPPPFDTNRRRANDFLYRHDPHGYGCPLGAHSRRANPRDALPGGAEQTMRHRIIRRGMPYAGVKDKPASTREELESNRRSEGRQGEVVEPTRQGLAFVCFNASITNGFEFIQKFWINDGRAFGLGSSGDFLLQDWETREHAPKMVIQGYRPMILEPPERPFVTVRGCEYLFVPSRTACAWLSGLLTS